MRWEKIEQVIADEFYVLNAFATVEESKEVARACVLKICHQMGYEFALKEPHSEKKSDELEIIPVRLLGMRLG